MTEKPPGHSRFLWRVAPPAVRAAGKLFFSLETEFETPPPSPPFVMASNHYSHFDSPVVGAPLGIPIRFLALEDLFGVNRLLDWLVSGFGAIPTPRGRVPVKAVRTALAALDRGEVVGVFPESTRVSHWGTLSPKRGAAWLAVRAGVPLLPAAVIGTGHAFGLENRLRRYPIRVVYGKPIHPEDRTVDDLLREWTEWIGKQIARYPGSEVSGDRRAFFVGL
ncbi:MAG: 1-acyl-sn-glycerol-3-phosphate acyltransferase [Actinobacteria bacterium]|nr:MAG: 1-acyl-sn-glycerol-3-phosphate acyltransferase [Actinomycetota bacterium]